MDVAHLKDSHTYLCVTLHLLCLALDRIVPGHKNFKNIAELQTTGLVGLAVAPNAHHTLGALYGKIIRTLQKMPETSVYRRYTEQIVRERAAVLSQTKDVYELEQKINCGQAEELIVQAENELNLARKMLNWKPWEPLVAKPPKGQWDWPPAKP